MVTPRTPRRTGCWTCWPPNCVTTGLDCTAIRWGLWQDAGVVDAAEIVRTQRSGLIAMRPDLAVDAGLARYPDDPLIFDADFDRLRVFFESSGNSSAVQPAGGH